MADLRYSAIISLFAWMVIDSVFVFRHKTGKAENRDRFSLLLLILGGPVALWISIGLAFSSIGALHSLALQVVGLIVMAIGITVRSTAIVQLGRFHTPNVAVRADHQLRSTGLYRLVRHPSYLGALIAYLGFGLALGNWASVLVLMALVPGLYLYRIHEEDAALLAAFGDAYRAYCVQTKRLIPWVY
jgi:protein-S-isoprenylcysteine O-methyltransferase